MGPQPRRRPWPSWPAQPWPGWKPSPLAPPLKPRRCCRARPSAACGPAHAIASSRCAACWAAPPVALAAGSVAPAMTAAPAAPAVNVVDKTGAPGATNLSVSADTTLNVHALTQDLTAAGGAISLTGGGAQSAAGTTAQYHCVARSRRVPCTITPAQPARARGTDSHGNVTIIPAVNASCVPGSGTCILDTVSAGPTGLTGPNLIINANSTPFSVLPGTASGAFGVVARSSGNSGGNGGDSYVFGDAGDGGNGADGGTVQGNVTGTITTPGDHRPGHRRLQHRRQWVAIGGDAHTAVGDAGSWRKLAGSRRLGDRQLHLRLQSAPPVTNAFGVGGDQPGRQWRARRRRRRAGLQPWRRQRGRQGAAPSRSTPASTPPSSPTAIPPRASSPRASAAAAAESAGGWPVLFRRGLQAAPAAAMAARSPSTPTVRSPPNRLTPRASWPSPSAAAAATPLDQRVCGAWRQWRSRRRRRPCLRHQYR